MNQPAAAPDLIFDGHNDTLLRLEAAARAGREPVFFEEAPSGHIDLPKARRGGFAGGLFAIFAPASFDIEPDSFDPNDPAHFAPVTQAHALPATLAMMARARRLERASEGAVAICYSVAEIRQAMAAGKLAMTLHIEGAEAIDPTLDALEVLHAAGLRSIGPVWSRPNVFGHGAPMAAQPVLDPGEGLTDAGRALVRECDALGLMVDLSHLTERGFWDVAAVTTNPLVATHSNAHALSPTPRNLTDKQLDAVAESGGVVGLNFHVGFLREDCRGDQDAPLELAIRHLDHLLAHLGEDGVALGSDFDGCRTPEAIGGADGLPTLVARMRAAGYGETLIAKICRENWLRALERVWGG